MASNLEVLIFITAAFAPVHAGGPGLTKSKGQHCPQKSRMKSYWSQEPVTKDSPDRVQHALETGVTYCQRCEPNPCSSCTDQMAPLREGHRSQSTPPQNTPRDTVERLFHLNKTFTVYTYTGMHTSFSDQNVQMVRKESTMLVKNLIPNGVVGKATFGTMVSVGHCFTR